MSNRPKTTTEETAFGLVSLEGRLNLDHINVYCSLFLVVFGVLVGVLVTQVVGVVSPGVPTRSLVTGLVSGWLVMRRPVFPDHTLDTVFQVARFAGIVVAIDVVVLQMGSNCGDSNQSFQLDLPAVARLAVQWTAVGMALVGTILTLVADTSSIQRGAGRTLPVVAVCVLLVIHPLHLEADVGYRPLCGTEDVAMVLLRLGRTSGFLLVYNVVLVVELFKMDDHRHLSHHRTLTDLAWLCTTSAAFVLLTPSNGVPFVVAAFVVVVCYRRRVSSSGLLTTWLRPEPYIALTGQPRSDDEPQPPQSPSSDVPLCQPAPTNANVQRLLRLGAKSLSRNEAQRVLGE